MDKETILLDLNVNRDLLDPKFECYRLSTDDVQVKGVSLDVEPCQLSLKDKHLYSLLHFTAFCTDVNYFFEDHFNLEAPTKCKFGYFVDKTLKVKCIGISPYGELLEGQCLLALGNHIGNNIPPDDCFTTISFPTEDLALILFTRTVLRGRQGELVKLFVVSTRDRNTISSWQVIQEFDLLEEKLLKKSMNKVQPRELRAPCKIIKSFKSAVDDEIEVVILSIFKNDQEKFESLLSSLIICKNSDASYSLAKLLQLSGPSYPLYLGVDWNDKQRFFNIVAESQFKFIYDSERDLEATLPETALRIDDDEKNFVYTFCQLDDEITVDFKLSSDCQREHIRVDFSVEQLKIYVRDEQVFDEELWSHIEREGCSWTLDKGKRKSETGTGISILEVTLTKKDKEYIWDQLLKGKERGIELSSLDESDNVLSEMSFLSCELKPSMIKGNKFVPSLKDWEQCDQAPEDLSFSRYDVNLRRISHQTYLGGHQWLFSRYVNDVNMACFAVRHDVDAIIWQPLKEQNNLKLEHIATFPAFGYVQASKQGKKFTDCSPDFGYAYIADSCNHIYLYNQPQIFSNLRNRKQGSPTRIGKQKVVNLGREPVQVLGSIAFQRHLLILSSWKIFCIDVVFE